MSGWWLLWDPACDKMVQSASVIFPCFQLMGKSNPGKSKGSLGHILNTAVLWKVPTERYFEEENGAIEMLPLTVNLAIPEHLGQALSGRFWEEWKAACMCELDKMLEKNVWEAVTKTKDMTTIGNQWVFDIKHQVNGNVKKFKACFVARGDH
ncbi:hypothetical protein O181_092698 [Austropuccinia psidii MF-1]|uniref:Reverse transcriptase Ty1/copia-type domain-containing protein n=1 Tax=Austropuccinia psidii MF-1 TaxID=1389203 RepID=A0A9Q3IZ22_9BASI|nr:hypothetical protein [Austropuccinia psidii MF-1]